jgi:serine/threonine protein kinase
MTLAPDRDPLDGLTKYHVLETLGRGGMGEVFLCEHAMLGHRVVVKVLHEELSQRPTLVDRMRLEAQVLARLRHPNLVRVTDFDETPSGRPFFVMEHLPGRSLSDELRARGGVLPLREVLDVGLQALAGLAHAHERGLVHRDVKLDNLFLCDAPSPHLSRTLKVLDFGVAKLLDGHDGDLTPLAIPTAAGMVVGTPRFFAPEQARGLPLDARADVYAFGLCLYVMLAGRGPFDDCTTFVEVARAHVLRPPPPPSSMAPQPVPHALDELVLRCIAKTPDERPPSAAAVAAELSWLASAL